MRTKSTLQKNKYSSAFRNLISTEFENAGLTPVKIARLTDGIVSESSARKYKKGISYPEERSRKALAEILDCSSEYLYLRDFSNPNLAANTLKLLKSSGVISISYKIDRIFISPICKTSELFSQKLKSENNIRKFGFHDSEDETRFAKTMDEHLLGNRLSYYRQKAKLTQKDVATDIGVPVNTYRTWEQNLRLPTKESLEQVADTLNVDFYDLYYYSFESLTDALFGFSQIFSEYGIVQTDEIYLLSDKLQFVMRHQSVSQDNKRSEKQIEKSKHLVCDRVNRSIENNPDRKGGNRSDDHQTESSQLVATR